MVESGVFEGCPPQAPFSVERHANADSAVAAAAPQARRTSNACSIRKLILQQCKTVGCGRIGNLDRAPAVFTCRARGGERGPAARAWRRFGWTTASVSLTEGVHCAGDRRNLHSHSLQLEARWSGSAGHRRYRIPGTSRSRLPGAVADNLAATVYARSARGGTRSPAARAGRRPGWTTASVSLTQGVHQLSNLRNAHSHECHLPTSLTHGAGLVEIEGVALKS